MELRHRPNGSYLKLTVTLFPARITFLSLLGVNID